MASCSQVDSFFQAHLDGELDPAETQVLEAHLKACAACRAEVASIASFHRELVGACAIHRQQRSLSESVLAHLPEMEPAIHCGSHPTDPGLVPARYPMRLSVPLAACAALLFVAGFIVFGLYSQGDPAVTADAVGMVVYAEGPELFQSHAELQRVERARLATRVLAGDRMETRDGTRVAIALTRGSSLKMNTQSFATVRDSRRVEVMSGQAYFDVGRDRDHFYVNTPTGEVLVYGTSFLVDVANDLTTVTVVNGDVLVSTPEGRTALTQGEQSLLRLGQVPSEPREAPSDFDLTWALSMQPDANTLALFDQTIGFRDQRGVALPAEAVYAVRNLRDRHVDGLMVQWNYDGLTSGHCGYFVHVADSNDNLLFLEAIDGRVFNDPNQTSLTVRPAAGPISDVDVIHVRLIPDYSFGTTESNLRVHAVAR